MPDKKLPVQIEVDEEMERLIVETVIQDFHNAEEARNKIDYGRDDKGVTFTFDSRLKSLKDLWYGRRQPKTIPWKYCSNRSMKIAMAILEMLHARMFAATWNENLIRWRAVEKNDIDKADRINKFMFWWVKVRTKMKQFFNGWVKIITGMGDAVVESSWDMKFRDSGEVEEIPIVDELDQPLFERDGTPSINRVKKLAIEEKTKTEVIPKENVYLQEGQKSLQDEPVIIKMSYLYSDLEQMDAEGKAVNVQNLLREDIKKTVGSQIPEGENKEILLEVKIRNTSIEVLKQYLKIDIDRDGFPEDVRVLIDPKRRIYLGGVLVRDLTKSGKRPLSSTKFNDYIDRVDELDGLGILEMVKPLSDEIDAIFNQMTDANTLSVLRPGFYDPSGELRPANLVIAPNKLIPVPDPRRNVFFPDFQIATERLLVAMRAVMEFIERLTGASSYIMGKESEIVGGSGTATRTQAIVMAAEQRFTLPAERLREGAAQILNTILDLVQKNLPPGLESRILGEDGKPIFQENEITQEGIAGGFDAYILGDASMGSKQADRQIATLFMQNLLGIPIVTTDPVKIYRTVADWIKSFDKEPERYLGPEPEMKDFDSPEDENTLMVQGDFEKVRAILTENHIQHMQKHQELNQSPSLVALEPTMAQRVINYNKAHIQEHLMMLQQLMAMVSQVGGKGGKAGAATQGTSQSPGLESLPGPVGEVARRQGEGKSEFSPSI